MTSQLKLLLVLCVLLLNTLVNVQGYDFTFEATLTVPKFSKNGTHSFSAGLVNQAGKYTYENALNDHNPGTWEVDMLHDHGGIATDNKILPGDKIYSLLEYNSKTLVTTNNVTVIPGPESIKAGLKARTISQQENFQTIAPTAGKMNVARLYVSLYSGAVWDFGPLLWENITITSQTTDPWWCNDAWKASDDLNVTGRATEFWGEGDSTICYYDHMYWEPAQTAN